MLNVDYFLLRNFQSVELHEPVWKIYALLLAYLTCPAESVLRRVGVVALGTVGVVPALWFGFSG